MPTEPDLRLETSPEALERALRDLVRTAPADSDAAMRAVLERAVAELSAESASIWVRGDDPSRLVVRHRYDRTGGHATTAPDLPGLAAGPRLSRLHELRVDEAAGEGAIEAAAWCGSEVAGLLRVERARGEWGSAERFFVGSLASRVSRELDREVNQRALFALREQARWIDEMEQIGHLGSWEWDLPTDRIAWSPEQLRIHGVSDGEAPTDFDGFLRFVHPDDREHVVGMCVRLRDTGEPFSMAYRVIRPDGSVRHLLAQGQMMSDATGTARRMVGTSQDVTDRRRTEEALRASEESYRTIFQASSDPIWVHDVETGDFLEVNRAACEMYGYSPEEMLALGVPGISWGEEPFTEERAAEYVARAVAGEPQRFEWLGRHRDGSPVWGEVRLRRLTIGGADRLLATARDISGRKRAEEELRRANEELERRVAERTAELAATNEALEEEVAEHEAAKEELLERTRELEGVFEALPDQYMRIDVEHVVLDARRGEGVRAVDDHVGRRLRDVAPPEQRERFAAAVDRALRTGERCSLEYQESSGDETRDFEARILPLADGTVIWLGRDITLRKRAERTLQEREEHFRKLIENTSDIITILDPDGVVRYQSPALVRLLGYRPGELDGQNVFDRVHPEDLPATLELFGEVVLFPGTSQTAAYRFRHADGSWRVLESTGRTLDPLSPAEGVVINSRDITERKEAEEALRVAKEEAERADRAKSEFLSRMSHELRTPMNSILGFAQLLSRAELPPQQGKSVQHILKAGRHLLNLINEVLEIAQIEAGRQNFSLEPVRFCSVAQEALGLVRPLAAQWAVTLEDTSRSTDAFVMADRQRLVQVMLNLLSNAIKYNRPGGRVRVVCGPAGEGRWGVRVEDTGGGIPEGQRAHLFTPFARLGAEQTEVEGTGLGLALSLRLCEAMGGTLALLSTGPEGSVFEVTMATAADPLDAVDEEAVVAATVRGPDARAATLLYVEDNLANLSLVETILLSRPGWRTIPALQGQLGVELARQHLPDLILLDLHLPDLPGEEVLRRLRADPRTAHIPVVIVSADATVASLERLRAAGADAYLTKPLDLDDFLNTVDSFLGAARP